MAGEVAKAKELADEMGQQQQEASVKAQAMKDKFEERRKEILELKKQVDELAT